MINQLINWQELSKQQKVTALARPAIADSALLSTQVANILSQVKNQGDLAIKALTEQFDGIALDTLLVSQEQIECAKLALSDRRLKAIHTAYQQIKAFHSAQQATDITVETTPGVKCTLKTEAIESVGLYIPAGSAPLPSTVLMLGVPAQITGCCRTVLVCPPNKQGQLANEILVAADLCGVDEIYTVGGAQAIAALAYGTESIKAVNKVFGPGNRYVTEAKTQLSQQVSGFAIDMPAGPSEVLVIADQSASPAFIAADLLSQAEHGVDSQVILLTDNEVLISHVGAELEKQVNLLSRKAIAKKALTQSRLILTKDLAQA
jgi:histidinol dehydrogenase